MSGNCSICLGTLSEPVCIPCGHVYCTNCLAAHVNSSNDADQITATCPTCRFEFYTVTPDLTYLPKKYHQYVLPAVRRVYVDNNTVQSLQKKLAKAEGRVRKLENDQELLLKKCEGHMAASQAHASSEYDALREIERLKGKLEGLGRQMEATETLQYELEMSVSQVHYEVSYWKAKYNKMKHRLQCVETINIDSVDNSTLLSKRKSKTTADSIDLQSNDISQATSLDLEEFLETPKTTTRHIRPIPRRVTRSSSTQPQQVMAERAKRPRVSLPSVTQ